MDQKKLHKTVETIASKKFDSEEEMLKSVLKQIIINDEINVNGGRIWQLDSKKEAYSLLYQTGNFDKIDPDFQIKIKEYPIFERVAKERTILADETNEVLREKGIFKYSASGVGEKLKIDDNPYYEYLLALNSVNIDEDFRITLNIISTALTSQIKQKRYSTSAKHLKADIDKARQLQKSILPEHEHKFDKYHLYGVTHPAEIVGGDFFDYLQTDDESERLGIALGDAASKGFGAAAEAMYISGALRMASGFEVKIATLMRKLNQLVNKIFDDDKFASFFYGELSTHKNGLFLYANAGHNPPIYLNSITNEVTLLNPTGPVLGPAPNAKYFIDSINFSPGDLLLIYSDGITESANADFEHYGEIRLTSKMIELKKLSPKDIVLNILEDVLKFSNKGKYSDDKTIVVVKMIEE